MMGVMGVMGMMGMMGMMDGDTCDKLGDKLRDAAP